MRGLRGAIAPITLLALFTAGRSEARCGKQSDLLGRTECSGSSGDFLLKFEDYAGGISNDPLEDEHGAAQYTVRAGDAAGNTPAAPGAKDPIILSDDQALLHGKAMRFVGDDYLLVTENATPLRLETKFEAYVSFWLRARSTGNPQIILNRAEGTPSGSCGLGQPCINYQVWLQHLASGNYELVFQVTRNDGGLTGQSCRSSVHLLNGGSPAPEFSYDRWYHVTIGGRYSLNSENAGVAGSSGRGRMIVNGVFYESGADTCLSASGGGAGTKEWAVDEGQPMVLRIGNPNPGATQQANFDIDELRIDVLDGTEALSVGCNGGAAKPECLSCSGTAPTGCPRPSIGTVSAGDVLGGVAVNQVLFNHPTEWPSILLYRRYLSGGGAVSLGNFTLCDSAAAAPADNGTADCFTLPADTALEPGEFLQVFLCNPADADCLAATNDGATATCRKLYTKADAAGELGFGATSGPGPCPAGGADLGSCLNGFDPNGDDSLRTDLVTLRSATASERGGVAWRESGFVMSAASRSPNFANVTAIFGLWPYVFEAPPATGFHEAFELTSPGTSVYGLKLRSLGDNASPNILAAELAKRDWLEITASNATQAFFCQTGGTTGGSEYLLDFRGKSREAGVELEWLTGEEQDLLGFRLYRGFSPDGPFEALGDLIPAQGAFAGTLYHFRDDDVRAGAVVWYGLELYGTEGTMLDAHPAIQVTLEPHAKRRGPGCSTSGSTGGISSLAFLCVAIGYFVFRRET